MNFPKKQISNFFTEKRASKSYSPPGSIDSPVNLGTKKKAEISLFSFDENSFTETKLQHVSEIKDLLNPKKVNWINLDGIDDAESVNNLGKIFNLHPLTIEDIINTDQRAKFEDYNYYIALMLKMLYLEDEIKTGLSLSYDNLSTMTAEDCVKYSYKLNQYALFLQRTENRYKNIKRWCENNLSIIIAKERENYGNQYTKYEERKYMIIVGNEYAKALHKIYTQAESYELELFNIVQKVNNQSRSLQEIKDAKCRSI